MPLKLVTARNARTKNFYIRGTYLGFRVDKSSGSDRRARGGEACGAAADEGTAAKSMARRGAQPLGRGGAAQWRVPRQHASLRRASATPCAGIRQAGRTPSEPPQLSPSYAAQKLRSLRSRCSRTSLLAGCRARAVRRRRNAAARRMRRRV